MSYQPRGAGVLRLLAAMRVDPKREFCTKECVDIMECDQRAVVPMTLYAMKAGLIARRRDGRQYMYRLDPYTDEELAQGKEPPKPRRGRPPDMLPPPPWVPDPDDPRIAKVVPGWKPPVMVCTRQA
jgi:hypothetical protein